MARANAAPAAPQPVALLAIDVRTMLVPLVGTSPLIVHRFGDKARRQIEDKQQKKAKTAKAPRDPEADFLASLYPMPGHEAGAEGAIYGFPASAFKNSAVDACSFISGLTKVLARGAFHIQEETGGLVQLEYKRLAQRCDTVTIAMGTRDLRYRAEFSGWKATLRVQYNAAVISPEQIINLYNVAGFSIGVGEWRPQRDGSYGRFSVQAG